MKNGHGLTTALVVVVTMAIASGASVRTDSDPEQRSVREVLAAIEARLESVHRAMTTGGGGGGGGQCDLVSKRMDEFEVKLSRIEDKLEEHLSKIRQVEIKKEVLKEPSAAELSKKMDSTAEKLFSRLAIFEAKSGIQLTSVGVKIQRMERHLGRSMDDTLDKILKIEEKNTQMMEHLWTMQVRGGGGGGGGQEEEEEEEQRRQPVKFRGRKGEQLQLDEEVVKDTDPCPPLLLLHNLSEAMSVSQKRVAELDGDVEIYTRKVLNAFRELSDQTKGVEGGLTRVVGQGNHTHEVIREGFRRIVQTMKPITAFDDILQSLHKKVFEFENTIDASFASLLVAQNMFIGLLQKLVTKMDEKSIVPSTPLHSSRDILWTALESHRKDMGRALHDLVWTVVKVGNDTMDEVSRTFGTLQRQQCPGTTDITSAPETTTTTEESLTIGIEPEETTMANSEKQEEEEEDQIHGL